MGMHTATYKGKRVCVKLRDGTVIIDRFVARPAHRRFIVLENNPRVPLSEITSFFPHQKTEYARKGTAPSH